MEAALSEDLVMQALERLQRAERASVGVDPDGIAYLDVADRIELLRAAYRARVEEDTVTTVEERRMEHVLVSAEYL